MTDRQPCAICGAPFTVKGSQRKTCGSQECQATLRKRFMAEYKAKRKPVRPEPEHPPTCAVCGQVIRDQNRYRTTCGDTKCQDEHYRMKQAEYRERARQGKPAKELFACEICGKVVPRKKITSKTCGGPECRKELHKRKNNEINYRARDQRIYLKNGLPVERKEGPPTRKCPRCGKPSYEWEYCPRCKMIVRGLTQGYTEDSLMAG